MPPTPAASSLASTTPRLRMPGCATLRASYAAVLGSPFFAFAFLESLLSASLSLSVLIVCVDGFFVSAQMLSCEGPEKRRILIGLLDFHGDEASSSTLQVENPAAYALGCCILVTMSALFVASLASLIYLLQMLMLGSLSHADLAGKHAPDNFLIQRGLFTFFCGLWLLVVGLANLSVLQRRSFLNGLIPEGCDGVQESPDFGFIVTCTLSLTLLFSSLTYISVQKYNSARWKWGVYPASE